jgi:hypothetical protein
MNIPLPLTILTASGSSSDSIKVYEIYLNRLGINSIETPKEPVQAEIGKTLHLNFLNRGAPIHITISSPNASMYTDFFHENLYILDEMALNIPVRNDCNEGFFDLEIITGYGVTKSTFRVNVKHGVAKQQKRAPDFEAPLQPVAHGRPHLMMVMMGIALILYGGWLYTRIEFLNTVSFIALIVGALYTWYRQV